MAAMTNLLVKDDTVTTPVEFTLVPVTDRPDPLWRAQVANVPIEGQITLTASWEQLKSGVHKLTAKLEVPVLETLGASGTSAGYVAPQKVAHKTTCIFTMFASPRSTTQNRADALKMAVGILQGASSTTATGVLDQASAGNAFVNSALPGPKLFIGPELPS
nr:MAG: coat protein [Leviviridae sp.]